VIIPSSYRFHPSLPGFLPLILRMFLVGLAVLCAVASTVAVPQEGSHEKPYALIYGTVWGPDDRPIYGVAVKLRREGDKKPKWEGYSDHRGEFAFRVPAGKATYYLLPDLKGLKRPDGSKLQLDEPVKVEIQYDERVDTGLHLK
jgi:hypothetical protein